MTDQELRTLELAARKRGDREARKAYYAAAKRAGYGEPCPRCRDGKRSFPRAFWGQRGPRSQDLVTVECEACFGLGWRAPVGRRRPQGA